MKTKKFSLITGTFSVTSYFCLAVTIIVYPTISEIHPFKGQIPQFLHMALSFDTLSWGIPV